MSWKLCLNLCSRRWLNPTLSRVSKMEPLWFFPRFSMTFSDYPEKPSPWIPWPAQTLTNISIKWFRSVNFCNTFLSDHFLDQRKIKILEPITSFETFESTKQWQLLHTNIMTEKKHGKLNLLKPKYITLLKRIHHVTWCSKSLKLLIY